MNMPDNYYNINMKGKTNMSETNINEAVVGTAENITAATTSASSFVLTNDNYYSDEANKNYMSVSQFKELCGTTAKSVCEKTGVMIATGKISMPKTTALLVGSYVDSYFEGTLTEFKEANPDIYKKTGDKGLKAEFLKAEEIIRRIEADAMFSQYMSGDKQVIMTGNLFGVDWKIKMDSYIVDDKIVDLKVMRDMKPIYSELLGQRVDFIHYWGYDIQGAIYQKIVEIKTGKRLPFYIACATKESPVNIDIIEVTQPYLDNALKFVENGIQHAINLKNGYTNPSPCGICANCVKSKILTTPTLLDDIVIKPRNTDYDDYEDYDDYDDE